MIFDGSDQRGSMASGAQYRIQQVRSGGLPISSGDAGQAKPLIRFAIEISGTQRQRVTPVLDLSPDAIKIRRRFRFAGHSRRSARSRVLGKTPPVGSAARKCEEQKSLSHASRIELKPVNLHSGNTRGKRPLQPYSREYR